MYCADGLFVGFIEKYLFQARNIFFMYGLIQERSQTRI
jgi:hypothetical protein